MASVLPVPTFGTDVNVTLTFTYVPKSALRPQVGTGRFRKNPKISFRFAIKLRMARTEMVRARLFRDRAPQTR
jgi:hypothetical protein